MEKCSIIITYIKGENVKSRIYTNVTIKRAIKLEQIYKQIQEKCLIRFLQFTRKIYLYTVMLAYIKQGKIITRAFHNLTENKVSKLRAVYQRLQEQEKISSLMFSAI